MFGLSSLLTAHSGLFDRNRILRADGDEPQLVTQIIRPNPLESEFPTNHKTALLSGAGTALSPEAALVPALGEALERHCASTFSDDQFSWAASDDLNPFAVDLRAN